VLAKAAETLANLQTELAIIRSLPQDGLDALSRVNRALKSWNDQFSRLWYELVAVREQLDRFHSCRDRAPELMNGLRQSLDRPALGSSSSGKLMDAAASTFARATALAALNPVNWLLVYDLLVDARDCLDCANDPAKYRARTRYWADSEFDSPGLELMRANAAMSVSPMNTSSGGGDVSGSSFSGGGDSGGSFGGGDCGGGGASSDY